MRIRLVEILKRGNDPVTFPTSPLQIQLFQFLVWSKAGERKPTYDSRPTGGTRRALAPMVSLRRSAVGTSLRQRRNARRHRLEARQSFRPCRVQDHARGFSSRLREALPPEAGTRSRQRTLLPNAPSSA